MDSGTDGAGIGDQSHGFAGLVALASDVSGDVAGLNALAATVPPAPADVSAIPPGPVKVRQKGRTSKGARTAIALLGVVIGMAVLVAMYNSSSSRSRGTSSTSYRPTGGASVPLPSTAKPPLVLPNLDEPMETKPGVGSGQSLNLAELRWCRYQSQRLEGARSAVQGKSDTAVRRFNDLIDDYNGRCGQFRYYRRDLDKVNAEVTAKAADLRSEGAALVTPPRPAKKDVSPSKGDKPGQGSGGIFSCKDAKGILLLGTVDQERCVGPIKKVNPSRQGPKSAQGSTAVSGAEVKAIMLAPSAFRDHVRRAANKYSLSEELLYAVIAVESDFVPTAQSKDGKLGLMQLSPAIAREMFVRDVWSPEDNIDGGARYLRVLANEFEGDLVKTLAAYHSSPEAVQRAGGVPKDKGTQEYVRKVLAIYEQLKTRNAKG